jgi:hypothetical protein
MECFSVDPLTSDTASAGLGPFLGFLPHELRLEIVYHVADGYFPIALIALYPRWKRHTQWRA